MELNLGKPLFPNLLLFIHFFFLKVQQIYSQYSQSFLLAISKISYNCASVFFLVCTGQLLESEYRGNRGTTAGLSTIASGGNSPPETGGRQFNSKMDQPYSQPQQTSSCSLQTQGILLCSSSIFRQI